MFQPGTRRHFLSLSGCGLLASAVRPAKSATTKGPGDFIIVEGHRDIWEQSGRTRLKEEGQHWDNFIKMLSERGLSDEQIGLILGGNYLRIWRQLLPSA